MPSIEEIGTWTPEETLQEIQRLLPEGTAFVEAVKNGWHILTVQQRGGPGEEPKVLWTDNGPDRRLLLLNAFGWLWLRKQKPRHPAWKPRNGVRPARPHPVPTNFQDPPDLDPKNIRAVYEKWPKRK